MRAVSQLPWSDTAVRWVPSPPIDNADSPPKRLSGEVRCRPPRNSSLPTRVSEGSLGSSGTAVLRTVTASPAGSPPAKANDANRMSGHAGRRFMRARE